MHVDCQAPQLRVLQHLRGLDALKAPLLPLCHALRRTSPKQPFYSRSYAIVWSPARALDKKNNTAPKARVWVRCSPSLGPLCGQGAAATDSPHVACHHLALLHPIIRMRGVKWPRLMSCQTHGMQRTVHRSICARVLPTVIALYSGLMRPYQVSTSTGNAVRPCYTRTLDLILAHTKCANPAPKLQL